MKKAHELSVLCSCDVGLMIFTKKDRLFQFASEDMDKTLLRYTDYNGPIEVKKNETISKVCSTMEGDDEEYEEGNFADNSQISEEVDMDRFMSQPGVSLADKGSLSENANLSSPASTSTQKNKAVNREARFLHKVKVDPASSTSKDAHQSYTLASGSRGSSSPRKMLGTDFLPSPTGYNGRSSFSFLHRPSQVLPTLNPFTTLEGHALPNSRQQSISLSISNMASLAAAASGYGVFYQPNQHQMGNTQQQQQPDSRKQK